MTVVATPAGTAALLAECDRSGVASLLNRAHSCGLILWREGNRGVCRGHPLAISAMLPDLRAHRAELLAILGDKPDLPPLDDVGVPV